ncbi:ceramide synthase 1-like [Oscarella lobularis]|uniref:ceramide synthase 1-like n=1 Tax=Oscarella lobularis TaxID=121494 RepID=UPI003313282E
MLRRKLHKLHARRLCLHYFTCSILHRSSLRPHSFRFRAHNRAIQEAAHKFPESAWRGSYYVYSWFYCTYLVWKYDLFFHPEYCWTTWSSGMDIPMEIYVVYVSQVGYYSHCIYATLCLDLKQKDYHMMVLHHVITIFLIGFSLSVRYYYIGVLLIFHHDINDLLLEYSMLALHVESGRKILPLLETKSQRLVWYIYVYMDCSSSVLLLLQNHLQFCSSCRAVGAYS